MPFCSDQTYNWAVTLWQDLNQPTTLSLGYLSGWLINSGSLGAINNRLNTCLYLSGDSPCIVNMGTEEADIANALYQTTYYRTRRLAVLQGGLDSNAGAWTNLKEGDSSITRDSRVNVAKEYGSLQREAEDRLKTLMHYWTLNHTVPVQVNAPAPYAWPTP